MSEHQEKHHWGHAPTGVLYCHQSTQQGIGGGMQGWEPSSPCHHARTSSVCCCHHHTSTPNSCPWSHFLILGSNRIDSFQDRRQKAKGVVMCCTAPLTHPMCGLPPRPTHEHTIQIPQLTALQVSLCQWPRLSVQTGYEQTRGFERN